jgi:hypothetical protein
VPGADDRIWLYVMEPPFGPGRNALARLREMALSTAPSEQVDAELFRTLDPAGSDSFLKVSRSTIYRVEGKNYGEDDEVLLCSHDDSIDYINVSLPASGTNGWPCRNTRPTMTRRWV